MNDKDYEAWRPRAKRSRSGAGNSATKKALVTTAAAPRRPKLIWRTRDAENSMLYNLQLDVAALQSEVNGLQHYRALLHSRVLNRPDDVDGSYVKIVEEYFRVFRHGYSSAPQVGRTRMPTQTASYGTTEALSPEEFLKRVMDENIAIGRFKGLAHMMNQWERYSTVLGPITLSFLDSQIVSTFRGAGEGNQQVLVTSRAQYHLFISLRTIEIMFPHLLSNQEIVPKILGRRITGVGKFDFVFDTTNNRIVRYEFSLDFMASFIELLGDPVTVAMLMKNALISDEYFIGDLSEFVPQRHDAEQTVPPAASTRTVTYTDADPASAGSLSTTATFQPWKMKISSILSDTLSTDSPHESRFASLA